MNKSTFAAKKYREHKEVQERLNTSSRVPRPRHYGLKIRLNEKEYNAISKAAAAAGTSLSEISRNIIMSHLGLTINQVCAEVLKGNG